MIWVQAALDLQTAPLASFKLSSKIFANSRKYTPLFQRDLYSFVNKNHGNKHLSSDGFETWSCYVAGEQLHLPAKGISQNPASLMKYLGELIDVTK